MNYYRKRTVLVLLITLLLHIILPVNGQDGQNQKHQINTKNIILLIGDGLGLSQIQAAMITSKLPLHIENFPIVGLQKTSSANNFITDSGAAATAIATGVKTNNGVIGLDDKGETVNSILEILKQRGFKAGIVATNTVVHATPAGFFAHQPDRNMYEEIAVDLLNSDIDVIIGGGREHFTNRKDNRNLESEMEQKGYLATSDIENIEKDTKKVLALVHDSHLPSVLDGRTPEQFYLTETDEELINATLENRGDFLPSSVSKAIEILNYNNSAGFFLLVEGSQIDPACHAHDLDRSNAETLDFDRAVGVALDFAIRDEKTLVVVTGDHETGGLTILKGEVESGKVEGNFATKGHTGIMLPVFSYGPGSEKFSGIFENTDFKKRFLESCGLSEKND